MAERRSVTLLAGLLTLFVALGAVLAAQPFDAWTPVYAPSPGHPDEPPVGDHALPTPETRKDRIARPRRSGARPYTLLRSRRARGKIVAPRRLRPELVALLLPVDSWGRSRSVPTPDRAPPRAIAA
jgi:hypothetical protein